MADAAGRRRPGPGPTRRRWRASWCRALGIDQIVLAHATGRTLAFGPGHLDGSPGSRRAPASRWSAAIATPTSGSWRTSRCRRRGAHPARRRHWLDYVIRESAEVRGRAQRRACRWSATGRRSLALDHLLSLRCGEAWRAAAPRRPGRGGAVTTLEQQQADRCHALHPTLPLKGMLGVGGSDAGRPGRHQAGGDTKSANTRSRAVSTGASTSATIGVVIISCHHASSSSASSKFSAVTCTAT